MPTNAEATVLLIEDDAAVRRAIARMLGQTGYTVHACADGENAVAFVRDHAGPIDLLLTDTVLPGMDGAEAASLIRAMRPKIPVLQMSGYSEAIIGNISPRLPGCHFIAKPFHGEDLSARINDIIDSRLASPAAV